MSERHNRDDDKTEPVAGTAQGQGSGAADEAHYHRRDLLKVGVIGLGVPVVMSLLPRDARAEGSWRCGSGAEGAQGSWQCPNPGQGGTGQFTSPDGQQQGSGSTGGDSRLTQDWQDRMRDERQRVQSGGGQRDGFVFPGSYEWRMKRIEEREQERKRKGEFGRFGSEEDWR